MNIRFATGQDRQGWVLVISLPDWLLRLFGRPNHYLVTKSEAGAEMTWEFSASIEEDGDLMLEWYKSKGNVVTLSLSATRKEINWAAMVQGAAHHGRVRAQSNPRTKQ